MARQAAAPARRLAWLANADVNRLTAHTTLHMLAWGLSGVFVVVYLLRAGLAPATIFLSVAAVLVLRFALRPLVIATVRAVGLRATLIGGTLVSAIQFPVLAMVEGTDAALVAYCAVTAFGNVFYWTCYHAYFAAVGDADARGRQVGARETLNAMAGIVGPAVGGVALATIGPWAAFGTAAALEVVSILPLLRLAEPPIERLLPSKAYAAARTGVLLFITDGWVTCTAYIAWSMILFEALGARFDAFGGTLAAAALAGAVAGFVLGRTIDGGHARRAIRTNAALFVASQLFRALCGTEPMIVLGATIVSTVLVGLYIPSLMTAVYNEAKASPCPLRFQVAAEGGWDVGGTLACLTAAGLCWAGTPLQAVILLAPPMILAQAWLLGRSYAALGARAR